MYVCICIYTRSLGNSLMRDLLADISGPASSASDRDMFDALASLEKQLDYNAVVKDASLFTDGTISNSDNVGQNLDSSNAFLPPGLVAPSAGAIVVGQMASTNTAAAATAGNVGNVDIAASTTAADSVGQDAFSQSLQQFSAMRLAEDFLKADSARKEQLKSVKQVSDNVVNNLFQGEDLEDYDVQQDVIWNRNNKEEIPPRTVAQVPPKTQLQASVQTPVQIQAPVQTQVQTQTQQENPSGSTATPRMVVPSPAAMEGSGRPAMPFAAHGMGNYPHPQQMLPSNGIPLHQHHHQQHPIMSMAPPPPPLPVHAGHGHGHGHPMYPQYHHPYPFPPTNVPPPPLPHVLMGMQGGPMSSGTAVPNTAVPGTMPQRSEKEEKLKDKPMFKNTDFPALGADESEIERERKLELERKQEMRQQEEEEKQDGLARNTRRERIFFDNASPNAAPLPATAIICTSMTSRDLCYVVHAILRPLLSFASMLDAYNADYYRWSYDDRKSRNLLFLGGSIPSGNNQNLPAPVWKETKVKAQEMEDQFRQKVEQRADEWSKEKQALGRVVKVNVKRPRALLATTSLSSNAEKKLDSSEEHQLETEEDRQRVNLWASRVAIDKGYQSYLNLVELRRLLQARPGDTWSGEDSSVNRREELLKEVEDNVKKLQESFGVKKSGLNLDCDEMILSRTLMLPKGRMLLSRVIDEGVLPHSSACKVLPFAIKIIFHSAFIVGDLSAAPPAGEDRLLRSLAGLVKTVQPSVDPVNLLACLDSTIHADSATRGEKRTMKSVLTSKRTLMELLYAIFSRGSEVCVGDFEKDWKEKETKFLAILSQN
jgi:hypothetical protein